MNNICCLQFLLYKPRVYSALDRLMLSLAKRLESNRKLVCIYSQSMDERPDLESDLIAAGIIIEVVSVNPVRQCIDCWRIYKKYQPSVVDVHFDKYAKIYLTFFSKLFRTTHFTHMHSLLGDVRTYVQKSGEFRGSLLYSYYRYLSYNSKKILCVSRAIRDEYMAWTKDKCNNVDVVYVGTPLHCPIYSQKEARLKLNLSEDLFILTNVSAIESLKGIDLILQAMALVLKKHPEQSQRILFVHIGGLRIDAFPQRAYKDSLLEMVDSLGISDNVLWLGRRSDVQDILPFADVYIHPSRSEGLGSAVLEAAMAKLPLIASDVGGIPEIVVNDSVGFLVPSENVMAIADAIEYLLLSPLEAKRKGMEVYNYVSVTFNQEKCVDDIVNLYAV